MIDCLLFCQCLRKSEISIYQTVYSSTTNEVISICSRVDFMHNILHVAVLLVQTFKGAFEGAPENTCYDGKSFEKFQRRSKSFR